LKFLNYFEYLNKKMTNLKTLELRQNKIIARMWINLFKEPIDAVSTNQSKMIRNKDLRDNDFFSSIMYCLLKIINQFIIQWIYFI